MCLTRCWTLLCTCGTPLRQLAQFGGLWDMEWYNLGSSRAMCSGVQTTWTVFVRIRFTIMGYYGSTNGARDNLRCGFEIFCFFLAVAIARPSLDHDLSNFI